MTVVCRPAMSVVAPCFDEEGEPAEVGADDAEYQELYTAQQAERGHQRTPAEGRVSPYSRTRDAGNEVLAAASRQPN
jgi:hypothetical protein